MTVSQKTTWRIDDPLPPKRELPESGQQSNLWAWLPSGAVVRIVGCDVADFDSPHGDGFEPSEWVDMLDKPEWCVKPTHPLDKAELGTTDPYVEIIDDGGLQAIIIPDAAIIANHRDRSVGLSVTVSASVDAIDPYSNLDGGTHTVEWWVSYHMAYCPELRRPVAVAVFDCAGVQ